MKDFEEVKVYLPHRYPFLFIDRILLVDLEVNRIECLKNISINEPYFAGHFPSQAIVPGVILIEAMAQAAGILGHHMIAKANNQETEGGIYYLAAADKIRFKKPVIPGDQLLLKANYVTKKYTIWKFNCEIRVNDEIVCAGEITCARKEMQV